MTISITKNIFIGLVGLVALLAILSLFISTPDKSDDSKGLGSIGDAQAYYATSTREGSVGTELRNFTQLKSSSGVLGSVVILGAGGPFLLYDATTTNITLRAQKSTSSITMVSFQTSAAANTYVFDAAFNDGLIFEETATVATATITWK